MRIALLRCWGEAACRIRIKATQRLLRRREMHVGGYAAGAHGRCIGVPRGFRFARFAQIDVICQVWSHPDFLRLPLQASATPASCAVWHAFRNSGCRATRGTGWKGRWARRLHTRQKTPTKGQTMIMQTFKTPVQHADSAPLNDRLSTPAGGEQHDGTHAVVRMTMTEWKGIHRDFKAIHRNSDGSIRWRSILRPGGLIAVEIIK